MLVSYKWLKELVDVDVTTAELAEKMSTTGIEVEGVETPAEGLSKLVVGHVLSCEDVPETHLHLCQVDTGDAEGPRQIVCGAPNVTAGIKVIVAIPGARIADNYKIKKGKIEIAPFHLDIQTLEFLSDSLFLYYYSPAFSVIKLIHLSRFIMEILSVVIFPVSISS